MRVDSMVYNESAAPTFVRRRASPSRPNRSSESLRFPDALFRISSVRRRGGLTPPPPHPALPSFRRSIERASERGRRWRVWAVQRWVGLLSLRLAWLSSNAERAAAAAASAVGLSLPSLYLTHSTAAAATHAWNSLGWRVFRKVRPAAAAFHTHRPGGSRGG